MTPKDRLQKIILSRFVETISLNYGDVDWMVSRIRQLEAALDAMLAHSFCECGNENCNDCATDCLINLGARLALEGEEEK